MKHKSSTRTIIIMTMIVFFFACPTPPSREPDIPVAVKSFTLCGITPVESKISPPSGLVLHRVQISSVKLDWNDNIEPDLQGYKTYICSDCPDTNHILFHSSLGKISETYINDLEDGDYVGAVSAYDLSGNESELSNRVYFNISDFIDTVAFDSLFDNFNDLSVDINKWRIANNSTSRLFTYGGVLNVTSNDNEVGWMTTYQPLQIDNHLLYIKLMGTEDFCIGFSPNVDYSAKDAFYSRPKVIRFYVSAVDNNNWGLYYQERFNGTTKLEKLYYTGSNLITNWVYWKIQFYNRDSVSWKYSFDNFNWITAFDKTLHGLSGSSRLYMEISCDKSNIHGTGEVDELYYRNLRPTKPDTIIPPKVDSTLVFIKDNIRSVLLCAQKSLLDTTGVPFDTLTVEFIGSNNSQWFFLPIPYNQIIDGLYNVSIDSLKIFGDISARDTVDVYIRQKNVESRKVGAMFHLNKRFVF